MSRRKRVHGKRRSIFRQTPDLTFKLPIPEQKTFEKHGHLDVIGNISTSKKFTDIIPLGLHGTGGIRVNPTRNLSLSAEGTVDVTRVIKDPNIAKRTISDTNIKSLLNINPSFSVSFNKKFKNLQLSARYSKNIGGSGHLGLGIIKKF